MSALDSNILGFGGISEEEADMNRIRKNAEMDEAIREGDAHYFLRRAAHFNVPTNALIALALILERGIPNE